MAPLRPTPSFFSRATLPVNAILTIHWANFAGAPIRRGEAAMTDVTADRSEGGGGGGGLNLPTFGAIRDLLKK